MSRYSRSFIITALGVIVFSIASSQQIYFPPDNSFIRPSDSLLFEKTIPLFTSFIPINQTGLNKYSFVIDDTVKRSFIIRKLKKESLIIINGKNPRYSDSSFARTGDYLITVDPLFHFEFGKDLADTTPRADTSTLYRNTRGFLIRGSIGENVAFETSFLESQAVLPEYRDAFVKEFGVVPGHGRVKPFKTTGYDFAVAGGYVAYSTDFKKYQLDFSFGHGHHFIGDGYRSLLLSDNSFNYPFFRYSVQRNNIRYSGMYAVWQNLIRTGKTSGAEGIFQRKAVNIHYLDVLLGNSLSVGCYESMISPAADAKGKMNNNFFTYNPIIGVNTLNYGLSSPQNILAGINVKVKISYRVTLYHQLAIDDMKQGKYALQGGIKILNPFAIRSLFFQSEVNYATPYTYSHTDSVQAYTHYNQPVAHPLGAAFFESVSTIYYFFKDIFIRARFNHAIYREDFSQYNFGKNIFRSDGTTTYSLNAPEITEMNYLMAEAGYMLNPAYNMNIAAGAILRNEANSVLNAGTEYYYITFRTSIFNMYWDF